MTQEQLVLLPLWYAMFLLSITCHEAAHAFAAYRGGDLTAYREGQVTLNPLPHMRREPFGTIAIPFVTFLWMGWMMGWASAPYDPSWEARHPPAPGPGCGTHRAPVSPRARADRCRPRPAPPRPRASGRGSPPREASSPGSCGGVRRPPAPGAPPTRARPRPAARRTAGSAESSTARGAAGTKKASR